MVSRQPSRVEQHSREPNVGLGSNIDYVAMRDVSAGEELTVDYALLDDYDGHEIMACHCNSASCRRVIGGHDWRRRDLQRKYKVYFSWCLQRRIAEISGGTYE